MLHFWEKTATPRLLSSLHFGCDNVFEGDEFFWQKENDKSTSPNSHNFFLLLNTPWCDVQHEFIKQHSVWKSLNNPVFSLSLDHF